MSDPAYTSDSARDGSWSLARESKLGHATTVVAAAIVFALSDMLGTIDVTPLPDWLEQTVTTGLAALAGLGVSWASRNR